MLSSADGLACGPPALVEAAEGVNANRSAAGITVAGAKAAGVPITSSISAASSPCACVRREGGLRWLVLLLLAVLPVLVCLLTASATELLLLDRADASIPAPEFVLRFFAMVAKCCWLIGCWLSEQLAEQQRRSERLLGTVGLDDEVATSSVPIAVQPLCSSSPPLRTRVCPSPLRLLLLLAAGSR